MIVSKEEEKVWQDTLKKLSRFGVKEEQVFKMSTTEVITCKQFWPHGYKTFSMLNPAEHKIYPAHHHHRVLINVQVQEHLPHQWASLQVTG